MDGRRAVRCLRARLLSTQKPPRSSPLTKSRTCAMHSGDGAEHVWLNMGGPQHRDAKPSCLVFSCRTPFKSSQVKSQCEGSASRLPTAVGSSTAPTAILLPEHIRFSGMNYVRFLESRCHVVDRHCQSQVALYLDKKHPPLLLRPPPPEQQVQYVFSQRQRQLCFPPGADRPLHEQGAHPRGHQGGT